MIGAFAYLIGTTTRNKVVSQLRRVRNPRYAIGMVLGLAYFWLVFFRNTRRHGNDANPFDFLAADAFQVFLTLILVVAAAYTWIFGADRSALAFTQAEVAMLFPAPVSRRQLIMYKLARMQAAVLTTSIIWTIIFRRGTAGYERAVSFWLLLSIVAMHRLAAALVRASQNEHGASGIKRSSPAVVIFSSVAAVLVVHASNARLTLRDAHGIDEVTSAVVAAVRVAPVSWVLAPFNAAVAPLFARTHGEWIQAALIALALLLVHFLWVVRSDTAFEEAAADASAVRAQRLEALRSRGISGAVVVKRRGRKTIPLASSGHPLVAIVWKNYLWLLRTGQLRSTLLFPMIGGIIAVAAAGRWPKVEAGVLAMSSAIALAMFFFGPMTFRNDLRNDLARIATIKTIPVAGRDLLFAEVASSASAVTLMQYLLLLVSLVASSFIGKHVLGLSLQLGIVVGSPVLLLGVNLASFSIHNGMALLFPAWVRVGEGGTNGIENMGQVMLTLIITLTILGLLCILPALGGAVVYLTYSGLPFVAAAGAGIVAGGVLVGEAWMLSKVLGGALERLEPMHVS